MEFNIVNSSIDLNSFRFTIFKSEYINIKAISINCIVFSKTEIQSKYNYVSNTFKMIASQSYSMNKLDHMDMLLVGLSGLTIINQTNLNVKFYQNIR
jgi:hypothetical protein